jgi:chromate reductase
MRSNARDAPGVAAHLREQRNRTVPRAVAVGMEESMKSDRTVAVLVGSLRKESLSRKVALAMAGLAPSRLKLGIVGIGDLPLYDEDLERDGPPAAWTAFRDSVRPADGVLFVTPEYNRSVPGVLKNAIDVGSRPYGSSVWSRKPAGVVSVSPGAIGGFGANHHLRQSLVFLDMPVMQQPEAYLGGAAGFFDDEGAIKAEGTKRLLQSFVDGFAAWIEKVLAAEAKEA